MLIIRLFLSLSVLFMNERYELVLERIDDNLLLQLGLDDKTNIINEEAVIMRIWTNKRSFRVGLTFRRRITFALFQHYFAKFAHSLCYVRIGL